MNIFKNGVGRPSNEIKRKRTILVSCIIAFFILLFLLIFTLTYKNSNNNKAGLGFIYPYVSITDNNSNTYVPKNSTIDLEFKIKYYNKKDYYFKIVYNSDGNNTEGKCTKLYPGSKKANYSLPVYYDNTYISLTLYKDSSCTDVFETYKSKIYKIEDNKTTTKTTTTKYNKTKTFTATFHKNGATKIGKEKISCTTTSNSCSIKAPTIIREGYNINGWSTSIIFVAKYKVGDTITLTKNTNFYAKTSKKNKNNVSTSKVTTASKSISMTKFVENWIIGSSGIIKVTTTPSNDKVTVTSSNNKVMRIEKIDNNSWQMTSLTDGKVTITAKSSSGSTVSYNYTVEPQKYYYLGTDRIKNGVKKTQKIDDITIYIENGVKKDIYNNYINDLKEIPDYMKCGVKEIYILTKNTFEYLTSSTTYVGLTRSRYGSAIIDVKAEKYDGSRFTTLIHELAHTMDFRYNYKELDGYLSSSSEWKKLFNKYKSNQQKALNSYAYNNELEFFASSFEYYYLKNMSKRHEFKDSNLKNYKFPSDIKKQVEESIKIFKNLK